MIKSIQIVNFGGIENLSLDLGKFTIFQGQSAQGKTSILTAINWAIHGGNDDYLIRNGTNTCEVILHSDSGSRIERRLTRGGTNKLFIYKNETPLAKPQEILNKIYNPIILNPTSMVVMKTKELNEFIQEAISSRLKLTPEQIQEYHLQDLDLSENAIQKITEHRDNVYTIRTEVNRNVKIMQVKKMDVVEVTPEQVALLEADVQTLKEDVSKAKDWNAKIDIGQKNKLAKDNTAKVIADLTREISGLSFSEVEIKKFVDDLAIKEASFKKMQTELEMERKQVASMREVLSKIETGQIKCPIFDKIICTTDMTSYKSSIETELNAIISNGKKKFKDSEKLEKEIKTLKEKINISKDVNQKKLELARAESLYQNLEVTDGTLIDVELLEKQYNEKNDLLAKYRFSLEVGKNSGLEALLKRQSQVDESVKKLDDLLKNVIPGMLTLNVKDVTLTKEGLFFRGLPLYRLGDSIKLRICTAILKDLFPKANLYNLDRMECIDQTQIVKYIEHYASQKDHVQYIATYVGELPKINSSHIKIFTMKDFKVV